MNNQQHILYDPKINEVQFPLFKFMEKEHAKNMLANGEIYIPNLYSFKKNKFGGLIDDNTEGEIFIENHYAKFDGLAEDVESIMLLTMGPGRKSLRNITLGNEIINPDALIYCTTSFLFSDSLSWAIKEGKKSCVMISDSQIFFQIIHEKLKHNYPNYSFGSCIYIKSDDGYFKESNADKNSMTNQIMHDRFLEFLLKPKRFSPQREVRAIFRNNSESTNTEIQPEKITIPEIKKELIEVKFSDVDIDILSKKKEGKIKMINVLKSGIRYSITFETPRDLMTPIIYNHDGIRIGFSSPKDKKFVGGEIIGEPPMYIPTIGTPIFACAELDKLSHIEIKTE